MKSKILILPVLFLAALIFSGCSQKQNNNLTEQQKNMDQNQNPDYISNVLGTKDEIPANAESAENVSQNEAVNNSDSTATEENIDYVGKYNAAEIETSLGKIKVKFYNADAPATVDNFLKLADQKFYDGTKFHRVIKDFMIQGGDPNSKSGDPATWGMGGPGYSFKDEINSHKLIRGSLAMANSGPNTNGSQFFIVTAGATPWLDGIHTNFGEVTEGMDVVDKIQNAKTGAGDRPVEDVVIKSINLLKD
jgi:cyclophilin family peptidyl-prolyl cis-trans isomerase